MWGVVADVDVVDPPTFYWRMRFNPLERAASWEGVLLHMADRNDELRNAAEERFQTKKRGGGESDAFVGAVAGALRAFGRWREKLVLLEWCAVEVPYPGGYESSSEEAQSALLLAREVGEFVFERVHQR